MTLKKGVLLLNLGGPDSLQAVKPFLYNIFADPGLFPIPFFTWPQKLLAWMISQAREKMAVDAYRQMGGKSPILELTKAQAEALEAQLKSEGLDISVYIGMRYWHPFIEKAVDQMLADGVEEIIVLPLYPQFSLTTTGSSIEELKRVLEVKKRDMPLSIIEQYHTHPDYQSAVASVIQEAFSENPWQCPSEEIMLLFSAHSLPKAFVEKTGDIYPQQISETIEQLMAKFFPQQPWKLCFQSKIGNIPWLDPYTDTVLREFAQQGTDNILIIPISFVSDHIETLYEIDLLYRPLAQRLGISHCYRTKSLNTHPLFIKVLSRLVQEQVVQPMGVH
jgi:protoporphyrin/coproporphyrin ferrochelatase